MIRILALLALTAYQPQPGTPANTANYTVKRNANGNFATNAVNQAAATTVTAAGTTTLTVASAPIEKFTGSTTQTVTLPDATTLIAGHTYWVKNRSTGLLTVNKNGGSLVQTVVAGTDAIFYVTDVSTSAGVWDVTAPQTNAATATSIASRDASGNSSFGTVTATLSGQVLAPFAGGLTAAANDTQSGALSLTANVNRVTTSTSSNNSVALPTAASGSSSVAATCAIEVTNVANAVHVFPVVGQTINGQSANVEWSVGIPPAGAAGLLNELECVTSSATNWDCVLSVAAPGHQSGSLGSAAANAGEVGEVIRNTLPIASAVALTSATACNVGATTCPATGGTQSITLTPGDWSCQAMIGFSAGGATSITILAASISKTTHALSGTSTLFNPTSAEARIEWDPAGSPVISASAPLGLVIPPYQVLVAAGATQQLFLVAQATFTAAGLSDFGSIECRRMR